MLRLVVLGEPVIRGQDLGWDDKVVVWGIEGPEVGTENHDAKVDVHVVVVLLHPFFELVGQVFAQTHVCSRHVTTEATG